jgi:hypothetical protein
MAPDRAALLRLYDHLANLITLDFTAEAPHIFGCRGTLVNTRAWVREHAPVQQDLWAAWLRAMCIDCDCALLLQLNTMATENGAVEGLNMRRCDSCNALLALYQVARSSVVDCGELHAWAVAAQVPAYLVVLGQPAPAPAVAVRKVYPPGETFLLTDRQFYRSVLRQIEAQHRCSP